MIPWFFIAILQAKAAKPGSQDISFKDINKLSEIAEQVKKMKTDMEDKSDGMTNRLDRAIEQLQKDMDKLKNEKPGSDDDGKS